MAARKQPGNADDPHMTNQFDAVGTSSATGSYGGGSGGASVADTITDTVDQVQQKAGDVVDQAREQAGQVTGQIREQTMLRLTDQKDNLADGLNTVARAIRQTGQHLREDDQVMIAGYADQAADKIEQLQSYIGNKDLGELTSDVERLARRQPLLFLGGSLALGILAARFLKSSSRQSGGSYSGAGGSNGGEIRAKVYGLPPGVGASSSGSYDAATTNDYMTEGSSGYGAGGSLTPESWRNGDATD